MTVLLGPVGPLELLGAEAPQRRVGPCPVVEALDVLEDLERRPLSALEGAHVGDVGEPSPAIADQNGVSQHPVTELLAVREGAALRARERPEGKRVVAFARQLVELPFADPQ